MIMWNLINRLVDAIGHIHVEGGLAMEVLVDSTHITVMGKEAGKLCCREHIAKVKGRKPRCDRSISKTGLWFPKFSIETGLFVSYEILKKSFQATGKQELINTIIISVEVIISIL